MTPLRQRMTEDMQLRNLAPATQVNYIHHVADFAKYFNTSPEYLDLEDLRQYMLHLVNDRKLSPESINQFVTASQFLYLTTLEMPWGDELFPWGQNLLHHPHVHCVVSGGGLSADHERWVACRPGFFLPVRVLSRLFRRLFLEALQKAYDDAELPFFSQMESLRRPQAFADYLAPLRKTEWVVYAKPPFGGPLQVLEYLRRYTQRVALSNQRRTALHDDKVSFQWKHYRHHNRSKTMTLDAHEFMRRFLLHTLPPGFQRIRHYGFLANCHRRDKVALSRQILNAPVADLLPSASQLRDYRDLFEILSAESLRRCPRCGTGTMVRIYQLMPHYRKPLDSS